MGNPTPSYPRTHPRTPPGGGIGHSEQKWPLYSTSSSSESSDTNSFATIELESGVIFGICHLSFVSCFHICSIHCPQSHLTLTCSTILVLMLRLLEDVYLIMPCAPWRQAQEHVD